MQRSEQTSTRATATEYSTVLVGTVRMRPVTSVMLRSAATYLIAAEHTARVIAAVSAS